MLQMSNVSVHFGSQTALNGLWYNFEPGQIYGLVGPNGCGKSTLMKTAAGLLKTYTGDVTYCGKKVKTEQRGMIAYLPTHPVYYRYMSIADMGEFYSDFFNDFDMDEYKSMISYFGLDPKHNLSGMSTGMVAKVRVAATLARKAGVILLDEPLNGIDMLGQEQIKQMIQSIDISGRIIIISSHLLDQLEAVCTHVVMMNAGKVIFHGNMAQLRAQYNMSVSELYRNTYSQYFQAIAMGGMRKW